MWSNGFFNFQRLPSAARSAMLLSFTFSIAATTATAVDKDAFFEARIRPVLHEECFKCHGGEKTSHGLRVDSREALLKGGESGPAIVPGEPDKSLLIQAIRQTHPDIKMPPKKKLPDTTVADFVAWLRDGAGWPATGPKLDAFKAKRHWAFEPVRKVEPPKRGLRGSANPIDRFVVVKLRERKLQPVAQADKRTLARRVYFDLLGLPPTPEELDAFLHDRSQKTWSNLVERLLASSHYGERWGRHWMDVVRYADTAGDNADYPIPEAYLYRDYIIDSFNDDKSYDQFVREQLAGDILSRQGPPERSAQPLVATGFLALSRRYGTGPYELWHLTLENTIETVGQAFMGINLRCARCHDHKYDPVTMSDYYGLYGIFSSTQFPWAGSEEIQSKNFNRQNFVLLAPAAEAEPKLQAWQKQLKLLRDQIENLEKEKPAEKSEAEQKLKALKKELRNLEKPGVPPDLSAAYAVQEGKPTDMYIQLRGEPADKGPVVPRHAPKFLAGDKPLNIPQSASGRLEFARWLTQRDNPLTARVMVNRIWQHHFGKGLVATPNNFGLRGDEPTHPELLDYLASYFVEHNWSVKAIHRLILNSKAYQLSSADDESNALKDPANNFYWRFDRRRLDAEAIRDTMMFASGDLDLSRPAAHPFPPPEKWTWTQHNPFQDRYNTTHRSVYLMTQRFQRHPFLALFDGPDTNNSTEARRNSIVPQQALFALNNAFVDEQAKLFARRLLAARADDDGRLRYAQELAWSRSPTHVELAKYKSWLQRARQLLSHGSQDERNRTSKDERHEGSESGGIRRTPNASAVFDDPESREAFGVRRIPPLSFRTAHWQAHSNSGKKSEPPHLRSYDVQVEEEAWTSLTRVLLTANEFFYVD
jgi:hypothetical protein